MTLVVSIALAGAHGCGGQSYSVRLYTIMAGGCQECAAGRRNRSAGRDWSTQREQMGGTRGGVTAIALACAVGFEPATHLPRSSPLPNGRRPKLKTGARELAIESDTADMFSQACQECPDTLRPRVCRRTL